MRHIFLLFCLFLLGAIVGCGGSGGFKNSAGSSTNTNLVNGSTPSTASGNTAPGTTTTATPPGSSSAPGGGTAGSTTPNNPASPATPTATAVVISTPAEGSTVGSPAQVAASVVGSTPISSMQLYVDDAVSVQASSSQINTAVQLPQGAHMLVAQAWDQNGNAYKSAPVHVMIQGGGSAPAPTPPPTPAPPPPPAPTANAAQVQTQPGWDDCDVCAGDAGSGPHTAHAMVEGISSPSRSGAAARFDVGGTPWGAALWWRELGSHDEAQNLRYDLDFYVESASNAQALEFDVNQTAGGNKYIFGTE